MEPIPDYDKIITDNRTVESDGCPNNCHDGIVYGFDCNGSPIKEPCGDVFHWTEADIDQFKKDMRAEMAEGN